jgi:RNA polymerase sigma factor (sigma-70 family)
MFDESVTTWLAGAKTGDDQAVQQLWQRYYKRLLGIARSILEGSAKRTSDEEDVALSAFKSFYFRAAAGKFPKLDDRSDLWKLLMTITVRKALRARRKNSPQRTGQNLDTMDECLASREPTPELAAMVTSEFQRLIEQLDDDQLSAVALAKLEGYTNLEIAGQLGKSLSSIERKLRVIRRIWEDELAPSA